MTDPQALMDSGLEVLTSEGAQLGDVRCVDLDEEWITVKNDEVDAAQGSSSRGFGIRALVNGAWGYSASNQWDTEQAKKCAREAVEIARRNASRVHPAELPSRPPELGQYVTPQQRDYFTVPLDEKLDLLFAASKKLGGDERVVVREAKVHGLKRRTWLASTEGTRIEQEQSLCGGGITAMTTAEGVVQIRSYPKASEGNVNAAGWEFIEELDLVGESERVREEALALLSAPKCPSGRRTLIVDGAQLSLQLHESCGHPIELDRVLGEEISLAGCSFLRPEMLHELTYGSPIVNIYADSTSPGGPGTFGWDDEGVPAHQWDIVKEGKFVGYLASRESVKRVPTTVPGAMRADSWAHVPIVRMVNINLKPGSSTLDQMISETEDGVLVSANRSWSIDDFRRNFQFSCEAGWEIKDGEIVGLVRDPVYTGITPEFWASCDAIANEDHWKMWGWRFCGKGDPMQLMHVGHGCSLARFQNVEIRSSNGR